MVSGSLCALRLLACRRAGGQLGLDGGDVRQPALAGALIETELQRRLGGTEQGQLFRAAGLG